MTDVPERFTWAVSVIGPKQKDSILEIGCGTGILLELMADALVRGSIVAIDKSTSLLKKAAKRNKKFIDSKRIELLSGEFSESNFKPNKFDKIVAFNINFFLKNSPKELKLILKIIKPKGQLYIFYQMPYEIDNHTMSPVIETLETHGFKIKESGIKKMMPTASFYIVASAK